MEDMINELHEAHEEFLKSSEVRSIEKQYEII